MFSIDDIVREAPRLGREAYQAALKRGVPVAIKDDTGAYVTHQMIKGKLVVRPLENA